MSKPLTPPDPLRCQSEITSYHPFLMGGSCRETKRCENAPVVIATEKQPGPDGLRGSMSLCASCQEVAKKQMPGACLYEPIKERMPS